MALPAVLGILLLMGGVVFSLYYMTSYEAREAQRATDRIRAAAAGEAGYRVTVAKLEKSGWDNRWYKSGPPTVTGELTTGRYEVFMQDGPEHRTTEVYSYCRSGDEHMIMYWLVEFAETVFDRFGRVKPRIHSSFHGKKWNTDTRSSGVNQVRETAERIRQNESEYRDIVETIRWARDEAIEPKPEQNEGDTVVDINQAGDRRDEEPQTPGSDGTGSGGSSFNFRDIMGFDRRRVKRITRDQQDWADNMKQELDDPLGRRLFRQLERNNEIDEFRDELESGDEDGPESDVDNESGTGSLDSGDDSEDNNNSSNNNDNQSVDQDAQNLIPGTINIQNRVSTLESLRDRLNTDIAQLNMQITTSQNLVEMQDWIKQSEDNSKRVVEINQDIGSYQDLARQIQEVSHDITKLGFNRGPGASTNSDSGSLQQLREKRDELRSQVDILEEKYAIYFD